MNENIIPPNDPTAERAAVAAVLVNSEALSELSGVVSLDDFYDDRNRRIYAAILELDRRGERIDVVTVLSELRTSSRLEQAGGAPYLADLADATPDVYNVADYGRIVAAKAAVRRVQAVCSQIRAEGYADVGSVPAWLQSAEARMFAATQTEKREETLADMHEVMTAETQAINERNQSGGIITGIKTGFSALDRKINGLKRGVKYTLAARPGIGKTALALNIAVNVASSGWGVVFISIEMPREQLAQRAIAQQASVDTQRIERGAILPGQWADITAAVAYLSKLPMIIDDSGDQTVVSIRSSVRRGLSKLRRMYGEQIQLGLVVIDHLNIVSPEGRRGRSRENDVSEISGGTRALAKEFGSAVLELSQLNRDCEKRPDKRPQLSDLRESGATEQDSFGVFGLYRDDYYKQKDEPLDNTAELLIRKIRQGGACGTVDLMFKGSTTNFYEKAIESPDGENYDDVFDN